jgi:phospholipase C
MDNQEQHPGTAGTLSPILQQIDHIVYLMLENRSLDNVLGWLYADGAPKNMVPPIPHGPQYDGLQEGAYSLPLKVHSWSPINYYGILKGVGVDGTTVPTSIRMKIFPT